MRNPGVKNLCRLSLTLLLALGVGAAPGVAQAGQPGYLGGIAGSQHYNVHRRHHRTRPPKVLLQPIDGGTHYFASHGFTAARGFDSPRFFPISVFDQTLGYNGGSGSWVPASLAAYSHEGINGFVSLYNGYDRSMMRAVARRGMWVFGSPPAPRYSNPVMGFQWFDEADGIDNCDNLPPASFMGETVPCSSGAFGGAPSAQEIARITADSHGARRAGDPTRPTYGNYTGGNLAWPNSDHSQAAAYVNAVDIASYDDYIIEGAYSLNHDLWRQYDDMMRVRAEAHYRHPVWCYIEAGNPETDSQWSGITVTPAMETAEAWNALIGGARGVTWFDHDFGGHSSGFADSSADLIDPNPVFRGLQAAIRSWDGEVKQLAPVLNSPFVRGYVGATNPHPDSEDHRSVNVMAKYDSAAHAFYLFAAPTYAGSETITFHVAPHYTGPVTVVHEHRVLRAINGRFTDQFADETAVHIYAIPVRSR